MSAYGSSSPNRKRAVDRPVRVLEDLTPHGDEIGGALGQDRLGLLGLDDEADGRRDGPCLIADRAGEPDLVAVRRDPGLAAGPAGQTAGGAVEHIDAEVEELLDQDDGVLDLPAGPVRAGEPDEQRLVSRPCGPHCLRAFQDQPHPPGTVATVGVRAPVGGGREELVEQVPMTAVELDHPVSGGIGSPGRVGEGSDDVRDVDDGQCSGQSRALADRHRAPRDRFPRVPVRDPGVGRQRAAALPRCVEARLAPRMHELDSRHGAARLHQAVDAGETVDELVRPDAEVAEGFAATALHAGALLEHESGATVGEPTEVHEMPVRRVAVRTAVLPHGRNDDPVAQVHPAQREGRNNAGPGPRPAGHVRSRRVAAEHHDPPPSTAQ